ncbi:MAG: DUF2007 domain-containing protein [Gammaproteobacteria bacterium]|nr:DUF2007 domain-containing protein [Gammaproteobacteria bacterium]MBL6998743.1 DUF2007 domain-containing protein [Gammaproteobacteria bacterium]
MKKLYTHENRLIVFNIKNLLEDAGIQCLIKNEFASGGAGDLVPIETWPEVWVTNERQLEQAQQMLLSLFSEDQTPTHEWICGHCHEVNDSNFVLCWNCSQPCLDETAIPA